MSIMVVASACIVSAQHFRPVTERTAGLFGDLGECEKVGTTSPKGTPNRMSLSALTLRLSRSAGRPFYTPVQALTSAVGRRIPLPHP